MEAETRRNHREAHVSDLRTIEYDQLAKIAHGKDVRSSWRNEDRARTKLKRLGLINFDRDTWRWCITDAGRAELIRKDREASP